MADVPIFGDTDENEGYYIYTISNKEGFVRDDLPFYDPKYMKEPKTYSQLKAESLWMPAFSYGEIEKSLAKLCEKNKKDCTKHTDPKVKSRKLKLLMKSNKNPHFLQLLKENSDEI